MPTVPTSTLTLPDETTAIPRLRFEAFLVSDYAAAMRFYGSWGDFPPAIVDQDGLVICGVHRVMAAIECGFDAKVKTVPFDNPQDRLLYAASDNATHGRKWSTKDLTHVVLLAERFGIPSGTVAEAMRVKVEKVERVPVTSVIRKTTKGNVEEKTYVKRGVRHALRGRVLDENEEQTMRELTTPNLADKILLDLLRLDRLDALPELNPDSYKAAIAVQAMLDRWIERDRHLLEAA